MAMRNSPRRFIRDFNGEREIGSIKPLEQLHVLAPEDVELALPKKPVEQISVPASINGRDLSTGRL